MVAEGEGTAAEEEEEEEEAAGAATVVSLQVVVMGVLPPPLPTRGAGVRPLLPTAACRAGRRGRRGSGRLAGGVVNARGGEVAAAGVRRML